MEEEKKWDDYLKRRMENSPHGTRVQWEDIADRVPEYRPRRIGWQKVLKFAAIFIGLFIAVWVYMLNSRSSWEAMQSESVNELSGNEGRFFTASELHDIYREMD